MNQKGGRDWAWPARASRKGRLTGVRFPDRSGSWLTGAEYGEAVVLAHPKK
jgi:hypothetical protein